MTDKVLRFRLDVPVEAAFRKADSFNTLRTYPIPPVTTVRGMIYAALGRPSLLNQDRKPYSQSKEIIDREREFRQEFRQNTRISIQTEDKGTVKTDLRNRMKVGRSNDDRQYRTYVAEEETIIEPTYIVYLEDESTEYIEDIKQALKDPQRLLYLGRSDDLVSISDIGVYEANESTLPEDKKIYAPSKDGENPILLPVRSDLKSTYSTRPSAPETISVVSGERDCQSIQTDKEEYFEFFD